MIKINDSQSIILNMEEKTSFLSTWKHYECLENLAVLFVTGKHQNVPKRNANKTGTRVQATPRAFLSSTARTVDIKITLLKMYIKQPARETRKLERLIRTINC